MANDLAAQARDRAAKVAVLEKEQEKSAADMQKLMRAVSEKTTALEEKTTALEEKTTALEEKEKEMAQQESRLAKLEEELARIRSREVDQGAFAELLVEKVLQTADFGEIAVQLSASAMAVGKQEVLNALMAECPQLKLKKERLGWDPHAIARANKVQQDLLNEKASQHDFREKLWEAQRELASLGRPVKEPVNEVDMRLEELNSIAATHGENSTRYKKKAKQLDIVLRLRHEESLKHQPTAPAEGETK